MNEISKPAPTAWCVADVSPEYYGLMDGERSSSVRAFMDDPRLWWHYRQHRARADDGWLADYGVDPPSSEAFKLGRMVHCAILEPERWEAEFFGLPAGWRNDPRDAKIKDAVAYQDGRTPVARRHWDVVKGIQRALEDDGRVDKLLGNTRNELTLCWTADGVPCRARLDAWCESLGWIVDLKTVERLEHPEDWVRKVTRKWRYDVQSAWYRNGVETVFGVGEPKFLFLVVEKRLPHRHYFVELGSQADRFARDDIARTLDEIRAVGDDEPQAAYAEYNLI